jgi:hypothetical protein
MFFFVIFFSMLPSAVEKKIFRIFTGCQCVLEENDFFLLHVLCRDGISNAGNVGRGCVGARGFSLTDGALLTFG